MNFEYHIYQYLLKHHKAEIPDFGVFTLTKESAKIDAENSIIAPPKETISFQYQPTIFNNHLAKYIAEESNSNLFIVQTNLKNEVAKWFKKLQSDNRLNLESLGLFQFDKNNKIIKITDINAEVFGLEEINIKTLKNKSFKKKIDSKDYAFHNGVLWTFLSLIIIGSATLFLFGNKELIFGESSPVSTKIVKQQLPKKPLVNSKQNQLKTDSTNTNTNANIQKVHR